ncbi:MAG: acyl-CoA dehydratase activase [Phycisphaerae bacterium]
MACFAGIDVGAVSAKAALISDNPQTPIPPGWESLGRIPFGQAAGKTLAISEYRRTRGRPMEAADELLQQIIETVGNDNLAGVTVTGSASKAAAGGMNALSVNEFKAIANGVAAMDIPAQTIFEMGGEASKYLRLTRNDDGSRAIVDYATNGDCAAGTGSFIDQQCGRLRYEVEKVGDICLQAERSAQVAGRCSVFAKSDMIHAQQKGFTPAEVLRGLCDAVARNFRAAVVRSHPVTQPVAFIGGVGANVAVVRAMREIFSLGDDELIIPEHFMHVPAVGAAVAASTAARQDTRAGSASTPSGSPQPEALPRTAPLSMDNVVLLRDRVKPYQPPADDEAIPAYLGIDIGSVSTNLVLIDSRGRLITEIYTRTQGRPIEVVSEGLKQLAEEWGSKLRICGVGTTGSGRELVGALIGADTINDEITCHKTGSTYVGRTLLDGRVPDTIFEIGGQDSKYISLQDGVVVDFTMNEACAAGTGSFLEERAEELDISIKGEFAELALGSPSPIRLGERCTVFMERDVNSTMQRGARKGDVVAGLAYSVVYNYINRVVRGRHIGETIFFQGGTAYNDAVAAAFSQVTGKEIIVPPHNGVIGAIGAALLARDKMTSNPDVDASRAGGQLGEYVSDAEHAAAASAAGTSFRGYDLSAVDYTLREFTCKGCSNACQIQEFTVEGEKTYWGDKCSDRFRKQAKAATEPVIDDLLAFRDAALRDSSHLPEPDPNAPAVGIPMTMFAWELLPFWQTFLAEIGYRVELGEPTNKRIIQAGLDSVVAEPCFPIIAAHGHAIRMAQADVDAVLVPNIISGETRWMQTEAHLCPWHQTLPFVARRSPQIAPLAEKFLSPLVRFREGRKMVAKELTQYFLSGDAPGAEKLTLGKPRIRAAVQAAYDAQDRFRAKVLAKGRQAIDVLNASGELGIVLVGRPYNMYDDGICLSVGRKLRDYYGVNVLPMDFLDLDNIDVEDVNPNMYWNLGRRILAAAKVVGDHPNLHIIYITNFKCGPDSFIKHFVRSASGKPFLSLQFDGHGNDAGMMTRCEAYLDSKGILRPWRSDAASVPAAQPAE